MATLQTVSQLAHDSMEQLSGSITAWTGFLDTAARLYRYPFPDQLLIHVQRPDATACASYELWNKTMHRFIRRGSKGIALIDDTGDEPKLRYVYDVSDTGFSERLQSKNPPLWVFEERHTAAVTSALAATYDVPERDLPGMLFAIADSQAAEYWDDHEYEILDRLENSVFDELDAPEKEMTYRDALTSSLAYTFFKRCGLDTEMFADDYFTGIGFFNTLDSMTMLGTAAAALSEPVLMEIGRVVNGYNRGIIEETERNNEYDNHISTERGLSDTRADNDSPAAGADRQVRSDVPDVSEGIQDSDIQLPSIIGQIADLSAGNRPDSNTADRANDTKIDPERPATGQGQRPASVDAAHGRPAPSSGKTDTDRTNLQLTLFPSEAEQIQSIAGAAEAVPAVVSQDDMIAADPSVYAPDLADILNNGLLQPEHKQSLAVLIGAGAANHDIQSYLCDTFQYMTETMTLETGEEADFFTTPTGFRYELQDRYGSKYGFSWADIAPVIRTLAKEWTPEQTQEHQPPAAAQTITAKITQDDIDAAIRNSKGDTPHKLHIHEYMREHGRERAAADFLKAEMKHLVPEIADGNAVYLPDGLTIYKGEYDTPAAKTVLTWPKLQRRILQLIESGQYLTEAEQTAYESRTAAQAENPTAVDDFTTADLRKARNDVLNTLDSIFFTQNERNGIIALLNENATNSDISLHLSSKYSGMTVIKAAADYNVSAVTTSEGIENTLINRLIEWEEIAPVVRSLGMQWIAEQEAEKTAPEYVPEYSFFNDRLIVFNHANYNPDEIPPIIARVEPDGSIVYLDENLPETIRLDIQRTAENDLDKYKSAAEANLQQMLDFAEKVNADTKAQTAVEPAPAPLLAIADFVKSKLEAGEKFTSNELFAEAAKAYGDTMANNAFTSKDAYDAMELGVNQYILAADNVSPESMLTMIDLLPTQTRRTADMEKFQQFSTPPSIAYLANYAANVGTDDIMLEPSAGIGGIAVFAKKDGATVYVNELDKRRLEVIKNLPFDGFFNEDAEQINNIHGDKITPTVIVMNPPFSSSAERNIHNTKIGAKHIEEALKILAPNGRLVAVVGQGMADDAPAFRSWWRGIKEQYNVKANIGIDGKNYNKYGTGFGIQMLVIDKTGATIEPTKTAFVENLPELQNIMEGIRNDRPSIQIEHDNRNEQSPVTAAHLDAVTEREPEHKPNDVISDAIGGADTAAIGNRREQTGTSKIDTAVRGNPGASPDLTSVNDDGRTPLDHTERHRGNDGRNDADTGTIRTGIADSGQSAGRVEPRVKPVKTELTDSIFEQYEPQPLLLNNVQPHPANISESAAMSAIQPPPVTYKPKISQDIIDKGILSDVQLEAVTYAGQSHRQTLLSGYTRGFFLGDGTGVGKGRTITGVILDNYVQGSKKAVWLSENRGLVPDAKRDVKALFGDSDLVTEFEGGKKADKSLSKNEGILFATYSALSKSFDQSGSNFEKIVNWLGEDFDGVIVFDEAHNMANSIATKGGRGIKKASQRGMAGLAIQEALPNAKIIYSSATGATEVENLRYAERLGLWGEGTAFPNGDDFVHKIKAGGLAAMELIARDMKAMGVYLSRNISYEDVVYDKIVHELTPEQRKVYDELARSWQIVLQNISKALETTNQDKDGMAKGQAYSAFWGAQQRFFNQILTAMQVPSMIADMGKQLDNDNSIVVQLVSTNEAAQEREFARLQEQDLDLDDFDLTPKQILMSYIENSFPTVQFEEYMDDNDNIRSRPVYDSEGKAVINREAVRQKEMLLDKLGSIKVPASALDMIINHFGSDMVAENTGRKRRVVIKDGKAKEENIAAKKQADVSAFQDGDKRIIVFSKAGGTGKSYHADKSAKNQQHRVHYLLQAGWQADAAVQGFGRSHRSNQVTSPTFALVTTDLKGQMRFISTIAKRLDQLGALTKGQRQTGSQGLFTAGDNLENAFAADVLSLFYKVLIQNGVHGVSDGVAIIEKLGLKDKLIGEYGQININAPELREVNKFLNRILTLESGEQNAVFDGYADRLQAATERAMQDGTLDKGLENYRADKVVLKETHDIRVDETTGATTKYYSLTAYNKIKPLHFNQINTQHYSFVGFYQNENTDAVKAVFKTSSFTDEYGDIYDNYKLVGQDGNSEYMPQQRFENNWDELTAKTAGELWKNAVAELPEFRTNNLHLIGGTVLPVWDKLPTENVRIYRVLTSDGDLLIGRVIPENEIDATLYKLGYEREKDNIKTEDLIKSIKSGDTVYLDNGWRITQKKVSNEKRIEIVGADYLHSDLLTKKGVFTERIAYQTRYFIPAEKDTIRILDEIIKISPFSRIESNNERIAAKSNPSIAEQKQPERVSAKGKPSILEQLKRPPIPAADAPKGKLNEVCI